MSDVPDDPEATVMVPRPGRRRPATESSAEAAGAPPPPPPPPSMEAAGPAVDLNSLGGLNPVVAAANPILSAVPRIKTTVSHPDPAGLRDTLLRQLSAFEKSSRESGVGQDVILVARYALCTLVDEAVLSTPWGGTAQWAKSSLLVSLHKEGWGGEKFFQLLNKMAEDPSRNIDLLELFYVCLALGFEGRFRVIDNGKAQLESVREKLYELIRRQRGEHERDLSARWRGEQTQIKRLSSFMSLWVTAAVAAVVLLGVYFYLRIGVNSASDDIAWSKIRTPPPVVAPKKEPPKPVPPRLSRFLEKEIQAGLVEVREDEKASWVTIRGDGLFEPGSATVKGNYVPLLERIADELNNIAGTVIVTGHTDDRPIRTVRFPSNWQLSQERAANVTKLMSAKLKDAARIKGEGLADGYPVAPNDTPENRAKNRRVEIVLKLAS